jgi:hypothetical protein
MIKSALIAVSEVSKACQEHFAKYLDQIIPLLLSFLHVGVFVFRMFNFLAKQLR